MKRLIGRLAIVALGAAAIGVVGSHSAYAAFSCSGVVTTDINANVVVLSGNTCDLRHVSVLGSIKVQAGGSLQMEGSSSTSSLTAVSPKSIAIGVFYPPGCAPGTPPGPGSCTVTTQLLGGITITGTTGVPTGIAPVNFICAAETGGALTVKGSSAASPYDIGNGICLFGAIPAGNSFGGRVILQTNHATVRFDNNDVGTSLNATGNTGANSEAKDNSIGTSLTVKTNTPCWIVSGNSVGTTDTEQQCP
jgi:hypothetical protein